MSDTKYYKPEAKQKVPDNYTRGKQYKDIYANNWVPILESLGF